MTSERQVYILQKLAWPNSDFFSISPLIDTAIPPSTHQHLGVSVLKEEMNQQAPEVPVVRIITGNFGRLDQCPRHQDQLIALVEPDQRESFNLLAFQNTKDINQILALCQTYDTCD